jgi:LDH2 family malate/lactate/ureidoglycolate dehydrogenase
MPIIPHEALREISRAIFSATGIPPEDARIVSDHLVNSNLAGHDSHGVWFVPSYARGMQRGYRRWEEHEILREGPSFVLTDGHGANGIVAVTKALDRAVEKARGATIGMVGLRNVTHIGRLGDYPPRIAEQGMIGMVLLNGGGLFLAPHGSAQRRLRPEPIAFAVPRREGPPFMLDLTLSVVAGGKCEQRIVRGQPLPEGWLIDREGRPVTDARAYHDPAVGMLPLGGLASGHKGYGLAMMVEMIVGPLTLAGCTRGASDGGNGVMIVAIDITAFTDLETYRDEVEGLAAWVTSAQPLPGVDRVRAPGDLEVETRTRRLRDGIDVPDPTWEQILAVAAELGVAVPAMEDP